MSCDGCEDCKTRKGWERQCDVDCEDCKTHPFCGTDWDAFASAMAVIHSVASSRAMRGASTSYDVVSKHLFYAASDHHLKLAQTWEEVARE